MSDIRGGGTGGSAGHSSDDSLNASLSTTPTQSHIQPVTSNPSSATKPTASTLRPNTSLRPSIPQDTPPAAHRHQQVSHSNLSNTSANSGAYDDANPSTIGRGQPNQSALRIPQTRPALARQGSHNQRSVSYATSDLETVSAMSASEYSSGAEDGPDEFRRSQHRGRSTDNAVRQATSIGTSGLLVEPSRSASGMTTSSAQKPRRASNNTRDSSKVRRQSRAYRADDDYLDAGDEGRFGPFDQHDDEVEPHDRGEELVRRRMKVRQREKAMRKKAEKERSRQSVAYSAQGSTNPALLSPNFKPTSGILGQRPSSPSPASDRSGRPSTIMLPPPAFGTNQQSGALSPTSQTAFPSPGGADSRLSSTSAYPSPHAHIRRASSTQHSAQNRFSGISHSQQSTVGPRSAYQAPQSGASHDFFSGLGPASNSGRAATDASSSVTGSVQTDADYDVDREEERDTIASLADRRRRDDLDDQQDKLLDEDQEIEADYDNGGGGRDDDDDDDEEEEDNTDDQDVEYTLKDRQDAINIEHPFGLPIWKPALYKKSRSVTRNAEIALHSIPSAAAERHFLPGNILWTIFFGSWLSLICYVSSILINVVPLGGSKYARVVWELGGYLFWPFGKYVEVEVSPESGDRTAATTNADNNEADADSHWIENSFTPVAARFPHDHSHAVPFNSRCESVPSTPKERLNNNRHDTLGDDDSNRQADAGSSSGSEARRSTPRASEQPESSRTSQQEQDESSSLKGKGKAINDYGTMVDGEAGQQLSDAERVEAELQVYGYVQDQKGNDVGAAQRFAGKTAFAIFYGLLLFPLMGLVCLACWGMVFPIPMAKLTWVLLKNLFTRPLALHFRSAPGLVKSHPESEEDELAGAAKKFLLPLKPGEPAPRPKSINLGRLSFQRRSKILLCTYRAVGGQYYKYTVGGVNILFVNTLPLVFFTILDFFVIERYVHHHHITHGFLAFISGQGVIFMLALGSVIPLSYFIGMAVASISAQSSIGMGAVINATFGSIIEIILYAIALTQEKARLVEGSLIGSILAGVLLMPGLSMCSGATRRKEQRFNARSAGVTSTMLIMAIIGILTPTLFYQIYGTFQLTCEGCPTGNVPGDTWSCRRCFYEHVPPATDPFFQQNVRGLMYTCTVILVLSYGVGLWFSLRTHASQIWQNPQPLPAAGQHAHTGVANQATLAHLPSAQRASIYKRLVPAAVMRELLPTSHPSGERGQGHSSSVSGAGSKPGTIKGPSHARQATDATTQDGNPRPLQLPESFSQEEYDRAVALTASAFHNVMQQHNDQATSNAGDRGLQLRHSLSTAANNTQHGKHVSMHEEEGSESHGGHDAPSWSRGTSLTVLLSCTVLYAIIAEILVDVVDVVLDGSGIDEKFLGITLFALVPNTTEFMNAMSFAINGNIALSMEIGSAYALQVCLIQIPAMVVFSAYYNSGLSGGGDDGANLIHRSFTLIFPRWDVIAIIFAVFLLTYTYIESRSNYYRGTICILSYMVLVAGFYFAPSTGDVEAPGDDNRDPSPVGGYWMGTAALVAEGVGTVMKERFMTFAVEGGKFGGKVIGLSRASGVKAMKDAAITAAGGYHWGLGKAVTANTAATLLPDVPCVTKLPHLAWMDWGHALWASLWAR